MQQQSLIARAGDSIRARFIDEHHPPPRRSALRGNLSIRAEGMKAALPKGMLEEERAQRIREGPGFHCVSVIGRLALITARPPRK
jgi:hypothetical protein